MLRFASALAAAMLLFSVPSQAEIFRVDDSNTSGTYNGSALRPFATIQDGIDAASAGDSVLVAAGDYAENVEISAKQIELRGGYLGASSAAYTGGTGGDFATQNPAANVTRINGDLSTDTVVLVYTETSGTIVDGFTITGGTHGLRVDILLTFPWISDAVITRNILESNGVADYEHRGGGLAIYGDDTLVRDNIVRNNIGGRGAGMHIEGSNNLIENNVFEGNIGYNDHGGGVSLSGLNTFTGNMVRNNRTGEGLGYGWAGGVLIIGEATLTGNTHTGNHAPSIGGGVFVDEGGTMLLEHDLVYGNTADLGAGVYVDGMGGGGAGSTATIRFCTIANNTSPIDPVGNAVYCEQDSDATVTNCIAWGNDGDDFYVAGDSSLTVTYTLSQEVWAGTGNINGDPRFANAAAGDFHVMSTAGRFNPAAPATWLIDAVDSPAINAGNPASAFSLEPQPNGGRVNMGFDGNTAEASKGGDVGEGGQDGEGVTEGEGVVEGEGVAEGEGVVEGEGIADGEGVAEGEGVADGEGTPEGEDPFIEEYRQLLFTFGSAETSDNDLATLEEIRSQRPDFPADALTDADANGDDQLSIAELLQAIGGGIVMSGDVSGDFIITLDELLRIIQLYNAGQYACAANAGATEDGFLPRAQQGGDPTCVLHSTDNNGNRAISLGELLRAIQFYSLGGYSYCPDQGSEDDFCG